jgi:dihydrofolate synthase/folylpolyglutamate synthase
VNLEEEDAPTRTPDVGSGALTALRALMARVPRGMMLGLDRVESALAAVGDPHLGVPVIHVAGSNGKGSTSAMIERIARTAGLRTGLYTSPHLARFAERIRVDGAPLDDDAFTRALQVVLDRCRPDLTFFESLTVAAFVAFREARVDVTVLEVGLGGRLDATNVVPDPIATAITSISLEHTALLGDTLDAIAREKAGILKRGAPVVLGPLAPEAEAAIRDVAAKVGAGPIVTVSASGRAGSIEVAHRGRTSSVGGLEVTLGLAGAHQAANAGVAFGLAQALAARFPERDVRAAVAPGLAHAAWPGRLERIARGGVTVLFDAAHNPEGIDALVRAVGLVDPAPKNRTALVFGALADKRWPDMLRAIAPVASRRYYTCPKGREPARPEELASIAGGVALPDPIDALRLAIEESAPGDTVIVAGSIYLVGELRAWLLGVERDPIIGL